MGGGVGMGRPWREPSRTLVDLYSKPLCRDGCGGISHLAATSAVCQARCQGYKQGHQTLHLGAMFARSCFPLRLPRARAPVGDGRGLGAAESWSVKDPADSPHFEGPDGGAPESLGSSQRRGGRACPGLRGEPEHLLFSRKVRTSLPADHAVWSPQSRPGGVQRRPPCQAIHLSGAFVSSKERRRGVLSRERFPVSGER